MDWVVERTNSMNDTWQLEWAEYREAEDRLELFFVEATQTPVGWEFSDRSTWEIRWQTVPPGMRLVWAAEYFKNALLQNRPIMGSIVYALRTEQSGFAAIQIVGNIDPILKVRRALRGQSILAEMRLRGAKRLARPLAEQWPGAALAA
jgi:hypothetical protein